MSVNFRVHQNIGYIDFHDHDAKVNVLNSTVIERLGEILKDINRRRTLAAVVFMSSKSDMFIAGADLREIQQIQEPLDGQQKAEAGQLVMNQIEDLSMPTVAVIDGVALGGGCELALACDYRLATSSDKVSIGMPEVTLGFIPGFGGTWRLPRLIGLPEALRFILSGKPINAEKALRVGLVDRLISQSRMAEAITDFVDEISGDHRSRRKEWKRRPKRFGFWVDHPLGQALILWQSRREVLRRSKGIYPAPLAAIDVMWKNRRWPRAVALQMEAQSFGRLAVTTVSKNLVHLFYVREKFRKLSLPQFRGATSLRIQRAGVVGAGIMGGGIAQALVSRDIATRLKDLNLAALALGYQSANTIFESMKKRRSLAAAQVKGKMALLTHTLDYSGFQDLDLVIEAVIEDKAVKQQVFKELDGIISQRTILASNTSALPIAEMGLGLSHPEKMIGLHFFNPVHKMPLVEVITTAKTSTETILTALTLVKNLGKIPILVKDSPGFVVNRILLAYMAEAGRLLEESGRMTEIDRLVTDFGMPMGPFLLSDEVGLDVGLKVLRILEGAFGERFQTPQSFQRIYESGWLGKKTKKGFYLHAGTKFRPNPSIKKFLPEPKRPLQEFEALDRLLLVMVNEAARCLQEGLVDEPDVIDAGMIFGTGFPPFRGGLLQYADQRGIAEIVRRLDALKLKLHAERFAPCEYLRRLDREETTFYVQ